MKMSKEKMRLRYALYRRRYIARRQAERRAAREAAKERVEAIRAERRGLVLGMRAKWRWTRAKLFQDIKDMHARHKATRDKIIAKQKAWVNKQKLLRELREAAWRRKNRERKEAFKRRAWKRPRRRRKKS